MIPKFHEIIHPLLELLSRENYSRKSATKKLISQFHLTDSEKEEKISTGLPRFEDRVGWAFTYLHKAEYIELAEERAVYRITDLGKDALEKADAKGITIDHKYLEKYSTNYFKNWQVARKRKNKDTKNHEEEDVEFNLEEELGRVEEQFEADLLQTIKSLTWQEFEDLCATLLEKMGYGVASKREIRVGDGGIDGEIFEDELGLKGKIYIQAKKWDNNNVQPKDIKEFLYNVRGNKGVFITTSDFSQKAKEEASNYKDGKVALINYASLVRLCKKYQILCEKETIYIYKIEK